MLVKCYPIAATFLQPIRASTRVQQVVLPPKKLFAYKLHSLTFTNRQSLFITRSVHYRSPAMIQPTRVLLLAKEKTQQLRHTLESEKFTCKLEKFITVYQGYNKLKPKIFPKRMGAMFPSDVVVASEGQPQIFRPAFGSSASLKRHQQDWSDKYQRTRPGYAIPSPTATTMRDRISSESQGRLQIVGGTVDVLVDKRKPYGSIGRARKAHTKSPRRVVLRPTGDLSTGKGSESSSDILCSSVFLTYREGLFFSTKPQEANCTDV